MAHQDQGEAEGGALSANKFGLCVHWGAERTIRAFRRADLVGDYPLYLVGLALPEHRCGPAIVALLTLADGGVLDAAARSCPKQPINGILEYDVEYLNRRDLERYRRVFYNEFGGFTTPCLESSPTAVAESMLAHSWLAVEMGSRVGPSPHGSPDGFPSDWTDVVFYSQDAVGCAVEGFAPSAGAVDQLEVSDDLKRAMMLPRSVGLAWLESWVERLEKEVHAQVPLLVAEAWAVRLSSPRASVALLRTVAELVAASLGAGDRGTLHRRLERLEERWSGDDPGTSPAGRRERARRESVLSCLHTTRDLGNRIHADSTVTGADVVLAHDSNRRLLEAVLRAGPLDQLADQ